MTISNFDKRMFHYAYLEATKSDYKRFNIGCVIAYKHSIIGRGHNSNKSHPSQKKYNRKYRTFNYMGGTYIHDSLHAEIAAIHSIPYTVGINVDWSQVKLYVYRICHGKRLGYGCAKPCPACTAAIKDLGVKHIYFTDDEGLSYMELQ